MRKQNLCQSNDHILSTHQIDISKSDRMLASMRDIVAMLVLVHQTTKECIMNQMFHGFCGARMSRAFTSWSRLCVITTAMDQAAQVTAQKSLS